MGRLLCGPIYTGSEVSHGGRRRLYPPRIPPRPANSGAGVFLGAGRPVGAGVTRGKKRTASRWLPDADATEDSVRLDRPRGGAELRRIPDIHPLL